MSTPQPDPSVMMLPPPRRKSRRWIVWVLVFVLLIAAAVTADRYLVSYAERAVATRLQNELGTTQPPEVKINGIPFLTQAATSRFSDIQISSHDVGANGGWPMSLTRLDLRLRDVSSPDGYQTLNAGSVTGEAWLDYDILQSLSSVPVTFQEGSDPERGRIQIRVATKVLDRVVSAVLTGEPDVDLERQALVMREPDVVVAGIDVPPAISDPLIKKFFSPIPLLGIPFNIEITEVRATPYAVVLGLKTTDLELGDG